MLMMERKCVYTWFLLLFVMSLNETGAFRGLREEIFIPGYTGFGSNLEAKKILIEASVYTNTKVKVVTSVLPYMCFSTDRKQREVLRTPSVVIMITRSNDLSVSIDAKDLGTYTSTISTTYVTSTTSTYTSTSTYYTTPPPTPVTNCPRRRKRSLMPMIDIKNMDSVKLDSSLSNGDLNEKSTLKKEKKLLTLVQTKFKTAYITEFSTNKRQTVEVEYVCSDTDYLLPECP